MNRLRNHSWRAQRGFTLGELIIGILCIGVCFAPFLSYLARLPELQRQLSQQARDEAWRSFQNQALVSGIEAGRAPALLVDTNPALPLVAVQPVERRAEVPVEGVATLRRLRAAEDVWVAEGWRRGSGFEISRGVSVAEASAPAPILPPIIMAPPELDPVNGSQISVLSLTPASGAAGASATIRARSIATARVFLVDGHNSLESSSLGELAFEAPAGEFGTGLKGHAWTEYAGDPNAGDLRVALSDGRHRWLVKEGRGLRSYEPSESVTFSYTLDLGAPVLILGASEYGGGAEVPFTYIDLVRVRAGSKAFRTSWPAKIRSILGSDSESLLLGFDCSFGGVAGALDGGLESFCSTSMQGVWATLNTAKAIPRVASGCVASSSAWTLAQVLIEMGSPELASDASQSGGAFAAGTVEFVPPPQDDGVRRGRLSARGGALVSAGSSLSLPITP